MNAYCALPPELRLHILGQLPLSQLLDFLTDPVCRSWERDVHLLFRTRPYQVAVLRRVQENLMAAHSDAVRSFVESHHASRRAEHDSQVRPMMVLVSLAKWVSTMTRILCDSTTSSSPQPSDPPFPPSLITPPATPVESRVPYYQVLKAGGRVGRKRRRSSTSVSAVLGMRPVFDRRWGCTCSLGPPDGSAATTDESPFTSTTFPPSPSRNNKSFVDVDEEEVLKELVMRCRIASAECLEGTGETDDGTGAGCLWTRELRRIIYPPHSRYLFLDA